MRHEVRTHDAEPEIEPLAQQPPNLRIDADGARRHDWQIARRGQLDDAAVDEHPSASASNRPQAGEQPRAKRRQPSEAARWLKQQLARHGSVATARKAVDLPKKALLDVEDELLRLFEHVTLAATWIVPRPGVP